MTAGYGEECLIKVLSTCDTLDNSQANEVGNTVPSIYINSFLDIVAECNRVYFNALRVNYIPLFSPR